MTKKQRKQFWKNAYQMQSERFEREEWVSCLCSITWGHKHEKELDAELIQFAPEGRGMGSFWWPLGTSEGTDARMTCIAFLIAMNS